jgi:hypothetical protein
VYGWAGAAALAWSHRGDGDMVSSGTNLTGGGDSDGDTSPAWRSPDRGGGIEASGGGWVLAG